MPTIHDPYNAPYAWPYGAAQKAHAVSEALGHWRADSYIQGTFSEFRNTGHDPNRGEEWEFVGCSVGCTLRSMGHATNFSDHEAIERRFYGGAYGLAYFQESLFEGARPVDAPKITAQFMAAIPVYSDMRQFLPRARMLSALHRNGNQLSALETLKEVANLRLPTAEAVISAATASAENHAKALRSVLSLSSNKWELSSLLKEEVAEAHSCIEQKKKRYLLQSNALAIVLDAVNSSFVKLTNGQYKEVGRGMPNFTRLTQFLTAQTPAGEDCDSIEYGTKMWCDADSELRTSEARRKCDAAARRFFYDLMRETPRHPDAPSIDPEYVKPVKPHVSKLMRAPA